MKATSILLLIALPLAGVFWSTEAAAASRRSRKKDRKERKWKGDLPPLQIPAEISEEVILPPQDEPYILPKKVKIKDGTLHLWPGARFKNDGKDTMITMFGGETKFIVEGDPEKPTRILCTFNSTATNKGLPSIDLSHALFEAHSMQYLGHLTARHCVFDIRGPFNLRKWAPKDNSHLEEFAARHTFESCLFRSSTGARGQGRPLGFKQWQYAMNAISFRNCSFTNYRMRDPRFLFLCEDCDFYGEEVFQKNLVVPELKVDIEIKEKKKIEVYIDDKELREAVEAFIEKHMPVDLAKTVAFKFSSKPLTDLKSLSGPVKQ